MLTIKGYICKMPIIDNKELLEMTDTLMLGFMILGTFGAAGWLLWEIHCQAV